MALGFKRLKSIFSSAVVSGMALFSSLAWAGDGDATAQPAPQTVTDVTKTDVANDPRLVPDYKNPKPRDFRGYDERVDDYFGHKFTVHGSKDNIWIGSPQRFDVRIAPLPENNGVLEVTREYIEIKPLKKEWYGQSSGFEYSMNANIGKGTYTIGQHEWHLRTGFNAGFYNNPETSQQDANSRMGVFVEGARAMTFAGNNGYVITGISYSTSSGPDMGGHKGTRVYTQYELPAVFGKAVAGDLGHYSASVKAFAGTDTSGAQVGIYYNDLKSDGKGVNFSAGPEFRYDKQNGVSYGFKVRVSPKFW